MSTEQEIPTTMRAAAIDRFGPPDVIHTELLPVPEVGKHEVLVRVAFAGVGEWDPELVAGAIEDVKIRFPQAIGSDGVGTVVAVGSDVARFAIGDRVYGWGFKNPKGGFIAEYIAIKERDIAPVPATLAFEEAGAFAVSGITALQGLEQLGLEPGNSVAIFGASGGLGHVAIQLAKRLGLRVFAVASQDDGVALAKRLGADHVIDGHSRAIVRELRAFAPDGIDGALVFASGRTWKRELDRVVKGGAVAWPNGVAPIPAVPRRAKRKPYDGKDSKAAFERLGELVAAAPFHVELSRIYSLDETAQALRDVQHHHVGKLAIEIDGAAMYAQPG
jgi:NADPH:quinone reductase-like Zn-dependent oxidoreductase